MPLLTSMATLAGLGLVPMGDYVPLASVTVGSGGASSIEFTSIPGTYQHLQVRYVVRGERVNVREDMIFQVNGDTGSNYARHRLLGHGSSAAADAVAPSSFGYAALTAGASLTSGIFGAGVIDILDYSSTSKNTTFRTFGGVDGNGDTNVGVYVTSSLWASTSAVNSFKLYGANANLAQYSTAALFGVKA